MLGLILCACADQILKDKKKKKPTWRLCTNSICFPFSRIVDKKERKKERAQNLTYGAFIYETF